MNLAEFPLLSLAGLSLLIGVWQWIAGSRFRFSPIGPGAKTGAPGITLLKPLKGADSETENCLRSWLNQDYPGQVQALFAVNSAGDPASAIVQKLQREFPERRIELRVVSELVGSNAKISKVHTLSLEAVFDFWVVSDADVFAPPRLLAGIKNNLEKKQVGVVNAFYQLADPSTFGMRWEAVAINADFWTQVLQSNSIQPMKFALGAVMATRRDVINSIGGFKALADFLADDYELGRRVFAAGRQIALLPLAVECREQAFGPVHAWKHQLRWAQTIRACQPIPHFLSIISNSTVWPLAYFLCFPAKTSASILVAAILLRSLTCWSSALRLTGQSRAFYLWMAPLKDLLGFGIWLVSIFYNRVIWRGEIYKLLRGGRLEKNP